MVSGVRYLVRYTKLEAEAMVMHLHEERSETETAPAEDIYVRPAVFEDLSVEVK